MKLRYSVEGKFAAAFTSSTMVKTEDEADRKVFNLRMLNQKEGYVKYSGFILYDDFNKVLHIYDAMKVGGK